MSDMEIIKKTITIGAEQKELYEFCMKPKNLALVVRDFAAVTSQGKNKLHWKVGDILGMSLEWNSTLSGTPYEKIICKSIDTTHLENEMTLLFQKVPAGTKVTIIIKHVALNALIEKGIETLTGLDSKKIVSEALKKLKKAHA